MKIGDRVKLLVDHDMGTWDIPAGTVGTITGYTGDDYVVDINPLKDGGPPLHGLPGAASIIVKPSEMAQQQQQQQ